MKEQLIWWDESERCTLREKNGCNYHDFMKFIVIYYIDSNYILILTKQIVTSNYYYYINSKRMLKSCIHYNCNLLYRNI